VHVVLGWVTRLLVRRRKAGGLAHDAPIVSRIYQVFSDGNLGFLNALKVVDTPFPFAYAQLNALILLVNLGLFPVIVADKVASLPLAAVVSFFGIFFLFGLNEVARDLEDPFTTELGMWLGANRLHAPLMQAHFDERILAFGGQGTAGPWPEESFHACYAHFLDDALGRPIDHRLEEVEPPPLSLEASVHSCSGWRVSFGNGFRTPSSRTDAPSGAAMPSSGRTDAPSLRHGYPAPPARSEAAAQRASRSMSTTAVISSTIQEASASSEGVSATSAVAAVEAEEGAASYSNV